MTKRQKIIYSILSIIFTMIVVLSTMNYLSTKAFVLTSIERETSELVSSFVNESNHNSYERIVELELMAEFLPIVLQDEQELSSYLSRQNQKMPFFTGLGFINTDGKVLTADGYEFDIQQQESFQKALTGEVAFSESFSLFQDPSQKVTAISVPVYENDQVIGVLSGVVNMADFIGSMAKESRLPGTVLLLDETDVVYSSSKEELLELELNFPKELLHIAQGEMGVISIEERSAHFLAYASTWNGFVILVDSSVNPDREQLESARWKNGLIILISIVVVIAVIIYVQQLEKQNRNIRKLDFLTGLGNRSLLEEDFFRIKEDSECDKIVVQFISIDKFIEINERLGYQMADRIVLKFVKRLKSSKGKPRIYRVGGEEFVLFYPHLSMKDTEHIGSSVIEQMTVPLQLGIDGPIWITVSVGVRAAHKQEDMELVLMDAMYANQEARKKGGNQVVYMNEELSQTVGRHRRIFKELESALENGEFYLAYQPIYSVHKQSIVSFETLMRWHSPVLGEVYPSDFIPMLEETDQIIEVGRWLLKSVANQINDWEREGVEDFTVALNVSVRQLLDPSFLYDVQSVVRETNVSPEKLIFELTESIVVQNIYEAAAVLSTLNGMGIKTALDDFGTGYSSLSILKKLPFQYLKIDRSFVWEMEIDRGQSSSILRGIFEIAKGLSMTTVVEGIETEEQLRIVTRMGACRIQGYYISKPTDPQTAISKLLESR